MGIDANAKLVGRSDGFGVGHAVPSSDMTETRKEGPQERTGSAKDLQEEMRTRKEWDTHEILGHRWTTFLHWRQSKPKVAESRTTHS